MKGEIEVKKLEGNTTEEVYLMKVPYEVSDDFGNRATLYKREIVRPIDLEKRRDELLKELSVIETKLGKIDLANR